MDGAPVYAVIGCQQERKAFWNVRVNYLVFFSTFLWLNTLRVPSGYHGTQKGMSWVLHQLAYIDAIMGWGHFWNKTLVAVLQHRAKLQVTFILLNTWRIGRNVCCCCFLVTLCTMSIKRVNFGKEIIDYRYKLCFK
jgi:hypothetical protein